VEEIRAKTGADSLGYLSLAGLIASVGRDRSEMCLGCFVGEYPNAPAAHQMHNAAQASPA
jgi:amidophosphoribosyltransferase